MVVVEEQRKEEVNEVEGKQAVVVEVVVENGEEEKD